MKKSEIKKFFELTILSNICQDSKLIDFVIDINNRTHIARVMTCHYSKSRHVCEKRYFDFDIEKLTIKSTGFEFI